MSIQALDGSALDVPTSPLLQTLSDGSALDVPTSPLLQTLSDGSAADVPTSPLLQTLSDYWLRSLRVACPGSRSSTTTPAIALDVWGRGHGATGLVGAVFDVNDHSSRVPTLWVI
ncbi:MAG: hypothetical protein ACI9MC_000759 [Kiritimatiellia bacterium]|jgi:hypothetical protein